MTRRIPAALAAASALVPWLSLGGPAWVTRGGSPSSSDLGLLDGFDSLASAALVLSWLLLVPAGLAALAAVRRPGPVWSTVAALHAVLTAVTITLPSMAETMWDGIGPDGSPAGGLSRMEASPWLLPLLAAPLLLAVAAVAAPRRTGQDGRRALTVSTVISGLLCIAGLALPLWWHLASTTSGTSVTWLFLPAAALEADDGAFLPVGASMGAAALLLLLAVAAPLRASRVVAVLLAAVAVPMGLLALLQLLLAVGHLMDDGREALLLGPGLLALTLAPLGAILTAVLQWSTARRTAA